VIVIIDKNFDSIEILNGRPSIAELCNFQFRRFARAACQCRFGGKFDWSQSDAALTVKLPEKAPSDYAFTLRIKGLVG